MDDKTFRYKLLIPLTEKDYGKSAREILQTCALAAEYAQEHTPDQVKAFQERVEINPQVWLRLLALHRDERLKKHLEHLPASYTTLYAIRRMSNEEVEAAVQQGVIHPGASSHSILSWAKHNRLNRGETIPPWRCLVVFESQLDALEFARMRFEMRQVAMNYGAKLISEEDYIQMEPKETDANLEKLQNLQIKIKELTAPLFESMNERDISKLGVCNLEEFIHVSLRRIGPLLRFETGIDAPRYAYRPEYIFRIALEYMKTDSRSQRYNCKRRLQELRETNSDLKDLIDEVLETYMK